MHEPTDLPPNPGAQLRAPGEVPRAGPARAWAAAALAVVVLIAALLAPAEQDGVRDSLRTRMRVMLDAALQSVVPPSAPPPSSPGKPAVAQDDLARPLAFYFARWGVNETLAPIGWTSRIEIRATPTGGASAKVWVSCPAGQCEAGELPVNVVAHLQKKAMTAFLSIERREGDRTWTLLLRPAPGRPDELERWEWYGPPGSNVRTQSVLGHVRRMRPDGTFH